MSGGCRPIKLNAHRIFFLRGHVRTVAFEKINLHCDHNDILNYDVFLPCFLFRHIVLPTFIVFMPNVVLRVYFHVCRSSLDLFRPLEDSLRSRSMQLSFNVFQKLHLPSTIRGIIHLLQQGQQMMEVVNKEQNFRK